MWFKKEKKHIHLNTRIWYVIVLYQMLVIQRKDVFCDLPSIRFLYQYTEFWKDMTELACFLWFYFGLWLTNEWKDI